MGVTPVRFVALLLALSIAPAAAAKDAPARNEIRFRTVTRDNAGVVRCGLFKQGGWLKQPVKAARASIHGRVAVCVFSGVKPGVYGISAIHDANDNGKLDTNFIGIPTEGFCASRDARARFGPPSFEDARFRYRGGVSSMQVRMRYF